MTEEQNEILFDLLTKKAIYGLDEAEQRDLDDLDQDTADAEFRSIEITAAAISIAGLTGKEPTLPPQPRPPKDPATVRRTGNSRNRRWHRINAPA